MKTFNTLTTDTLPSTVHDRSVWYGAEMAERQDWVECLSEAEVEEVRKAVVERTTASEEELTSLTTSEVEAKRIPSSKVELPTFGPRLRGMLDEVLNGRGFVLIKGLPVEGWTNDAASAKREAAIARREPAITKREAVIA